MDQFQTASTSVGEFRPFTSCPVVHFICQVAPLIHQADAFPVIAELAGEFPYHRCVSINFPESIHVRSNQEETARGQGGSCREHVSDAIIEFPPTQIDGFVAAIVKFDVFAPGQIGGRIIHDFIDDDSILDDRLIGGIGSRGLGGIPLGTTFGKRLPGPSQAWCVKTIGLQNRVLSVGNGNSVASLTDFGLDVHLQPALSRNGFLYPDAFIKRISQDDAKCVGRDGNVFLIEHFHPLQLSFFRVVHFIQFHFWTVAVASVSVIRCWSGERKPFCPAIGFSSDGTSILGDRRADSGERRFSIG